MLILLWGLFDVRSIGQGTVPNTFIGGKSVGGNSKLQKLHKKGELEPLLKQAGAL